MTTVATPPVREDGLCVGCGGSRDKTRAHKGDNKTGTRVEASFWRAAVERDPFCSRECCARFHGLLVDEVRACESCGKDFTPTPELDTTLQKFCSRRCQCRHKKRAKYDDKDKCVGCGVPYEERTIGCAHCWQRMRRREQRVNDPLYVARENARNEARKLARKKAREEARRAAEQSAPARHMAGIEPHMASGSPRRGDSPTTTTSGEATKPAATERRAA